MSLSSEQVACGHTAEGDWQRLMSQSNRAGGCRQFAKRCSHKKRRQQERRDPENAPRRNAYHGWSW